MKASELILVLLQRIIDHGDLPVQAEHFEMGVAPIKAANFTYNDTETVAWIELDWF